MKHILFTIACLAFLVPFNAKAQLQGEALIDSLVKKLSSCKEDSNRIFLLNKIAFSYFDYDVDKALPYSQEALQLATKLHWDKGVAIAYNSFGVNYMLRKEMPKALDYFNKALLINRTIKNKKGEAQNVGNIAIVYNNLGSYPKALNYLFEALKVFEELNDSVGIANQLLNIGSIYQETDNPAKALYYDSLALLKYKVLNLKDGIAMQLGNISNALSDLKRNDDALKYGLESLALYKELNQTEGIVRALNNIGVWYETNGDLVKALEYAMNALALNKQYENKSGMMQSYGNIGGLYIKLAQQQTALPVNAIIPSTKKECIELAKTNMQKAIAIGNETGELSAWTDYLRVYADALEADGNFKEALLNFKKFHTLNDSLHSTDTKIKIENITTVREMDLKDKQIEIDKLAVEKKKDREWFLLVALIGLMVIALTIFRNYSKQKVLNSELKKEKQKSDDLLLNILPAEIAEELKSKGSSEAKHYENVSVLFTDFVNFSGISETMSAQELVTEINVCFKRFDEIMDSHKLEKIKTIGDAYLAVCGLPHQFEDHAERVVNAALDIKDFILKRNSKFEIRIGIHSGPVVAGIVGIKKYAYDIWGDTVNTANRMESNSEPGKINISESTYELIKSKFKCQYRGAVSVKNKGEMNMYFVDH